MLKTEGANIVNIDDMGLRQLAYPINKRSSGVYYSTEFQVENGSMLTKLELALRRDERIMRFLTVKLDKYGIKYNEDKRNGLIGKVQKPEKKGSKKDSRDSRKPQAKKVVKPAPAAAAPVAAQKEEE